MTARKIPDTSIVPGVFGFGPSAAAKQPPPRPSDVADLVIDFTSKENAAVLAMDLKLTQEQVLNMMKRWDGIEQHLYNRKVKNEGSHDELFTLNEAFLHAHRALTTPSLFWAEEDFYNGPYGINKGPMGPNVNNRPGPPDYATSSTRSTKQLDFKLGGFATRDRVKIMNDASRRFGAYLPTPMNSQWTEYEHMLRSEMQQNKRSTQIKRERPPILADQIMASLRETRPPPPSVVRAPT